MRRFAALTAVLAVAGLVASGAQAKLTQKEETWAAPLIKVWNTQNTALKKVLSQAAANGALIAGERPHNYALTQTLAALVDCKAPKDKIKLAGAPPTARLLGFRSQLSAACTANYNGAVDFAKAIGAVTKNKMSAVKTYLAAGVAQFKKGTLALAKAYNAMVVLGGKNIFAS